MTIFLFLCLTVLIQDLIEIAVRVFMTPLLWIWTEMATVIKLFEQ